MKRRALSGTQSCRDASGGLPISLRLAAACIAVFLFCLVLAPCRLHADVTYTVKSGDTLAGIASQYFPLAEPYTKREFINEIKELNHIGDKGISPGQTLTIPVVRSEPLRPSSVKRSKGFVARGIYANQWTAGTSHVLSMSDRIRKYGANTVVFDAKEVQGLPTYRSSVPLRHLGLASYDRPVEDVGKLVDYLHKRGVHVVARVCMFKDIRNAAANAQWRFDKDWVNPANKAVQEYNMDIIRELIGFGVDEIQVDYFRYPTNGKANTGIKGKTRSDVLAGYAGRIHDLTSSKGVLLSLDMFGIVIWQKDEDIRVLGQDVMKLKKHFDIISPMLYPSHFPKGFSGEKNPADKPYFFVSRGIKRMKDLVGDEVTIRPWLQSFPLRITTGYNPGYVMTQVRAAQESGAVGWLLWSPSNRYEEAYRAMEELSRQGGQRAVKTAGALQ
jgi:hypothetical protein